MSRIMDDMRQEVMHEEAVRISKRILEPDSPNKKKMKLKSSNKCSKLFPNLKIWGTLEIVN